MAAFIVKQETVDWNAVEEWLKQMEDCLERHQDVKKVLREILPAYHKAG